MAYFRVKHITINGNPISDSQRYTILDRDFKKNIYDLPLNDIRIRLQSIYAIQRVNILRKYPNTLEVELLDNKIIAFIRYIDYKKKPLYLV
jgi:cell division septal protein FtsQ